MITNSWKNQLLIEKLNSSNGLLYKQYNNNLGILFHEKMPHGAALRHLQKTLFHLSYWETPYYKKAIKKFIAEIGAVHNKIAIDIGCGDGRFTELLLNKGFKKIIAIDTDPKPLLSLSAYLKRKGLLDNVLIINCSADNVPIKSQSIDLVLSIGTFYYLNNKFENGLNEANRILKPNGILINSEPDLEGVIYKSLFFEEISDVFENLFEKKFKEEKGNTKYKFRLFTAEDIKSLLNKSGFKITDFHRLSLLPSILRIKTVRGEISQDSLKLNKVKIRKVFDYFDQNGLLSKHIIWKSKKNE